MIPKMYNNKKCLYFPYFSRWFLLSPKKIDKMSENNRYWSSHWKRHLLATWHHWKNHLPTSPLKLPPEQCCSWHLEGWPWNSLPQSFLKVSRKLCLLRFSGYTCCTIPETNSSHLKIDPCKKENPTSTGNHHFHWLCQFRECKSRWMKCGSKLKNDVSNWSEIFP